MKFLRRTIGILALVADLSLSTGGCVVDISDVDVDGDSWTDEQKVEVSASFSRVVPAQGRDRLLLVGINGSALIRGVAGAQEVTIEAVRRVRSHSRWDAEEHLGLLQVQVLTDSENLEIRTQQPGSTGGRGYEVDYDVAIPAHWLVRVVQGNGGVRVWDMGGDAWVENGNGDVVFSGQRGSVHGSVGNGEIRADVDLPPHSQVVLAAGNGGIQLTIPSRASAAFEARVGNGVITVTGLTFSQWVSTSRSAQGVLGSGEGLLDLSVGNGWILVKAG